VKIAIVRLTSLGDIIFCATALQLIKRRFPDSSITWFADGRFADILDYNPDLCRVVKVNLKELKSAFSLESLKKEYGKLTDAGPFDLAIDMHGMIKSAFIARKVGRVRCGFNHLAAKEPLATLCYDKTFPIPLEMNTVCRYATLAARSLEMNFDERELKEKKPFLFFRPQDQEISAGHFCSDRKNVIFIVGSTWESRNYPKERFVTIANTLKENILICHGTAAEFETARYIAERSPYASILPRMDLNQLKAAVSRADLLIGGDTGPSHIAWANNVPCIVIFGPTPVHRIYPGPACQTLKSDSAVFEKRLNKNDFSIREIHESAVVELAVELLASGHRQPRLPLTDQI
jgi:heptosyltransferase I